MQMGPDRALRKNHELPREVDPPYVWREAALNGFEIERRS